MLELDRPKVVAHVLDELSKGRSLAAICEKDKCISYSQWMLWQRSDPELTEDVARAREAGATRHVEEIVAISDNRKEDANSRKVRIYAREKYAAMIAPQRFGQRMDVTSGGKPLEAPPPITLQIDNRVQALLLLAAQRAAGALPAPDELDEIMK